MEGQALRDHLMSYQRQTGKVHPMLADAPAIPPGMGMLWRDFMSLHAGRASNGYGPSALSYRDLRAFQEVEGVRFSPWEILAIRKADSAYLEQRAKDTKAKASRK